MFIIFSCLFFILLISSAIFGFGWFYLSFTWLFRILFWVFLIGLLASLIMALVNRGRGQPANK